MTEHNTAQQQFADRLGARSASRATHGSARCGVVRARSNRSFADRLRSSLGVR